MRSKRTKLLAITLLIFSTLFLNVRALGCTYEIEAPNKSFGPNEDVALSIIIITGNEAELTPEAFKCEIKFDSNTSKYRKVNCSAEIKRKDIKVEKSNGCLTVLYNPCKPRKFSFQNGKAKMFEIMFTVKNKVCARTTSVHADFKNSDSNTLMCSSDSEINITGNLKMKSCKLKSLAPNHGNISPAFDRNVFDYTMEVPSETQNIDFTAVPMSEDLSVKVSRRKLAAAGKSTNIKVTVSDKSLKIKSVYNIEVKRLPKNAENKSKSNEKSETKRNSESDVKTKKKHKKSKGSSKYDGVNIEENQEQSDELESENTEIQNNSDIVVSENSSVKTYLMATFCLIVATVAVYFIIRFVKFRKKSHEKPNNSINNNLKK